MTTTPTDSANLQRTHVEKVSLSTQAFLGKEQEAVSLSSSLVTSSHGALFWVAGTGRNESRHVGPFSSRP